MTTTYPSNQDRLSFNKWAIYIRHEVAKSYFQKEVNKHQSPNENSDKKVSK
jgi:hypothetical protein